MYGHERVVIHLHCTLPYFLKVEPQVGMLCLLLLLPVLHNSYQGVLQMVIKTYTLSAARAWPLETSSFELDTHNSFAGGQLHQHHRWLADSWQLAAAAGKQTAACCRAVGQQSTL